MLPRPAVALAALTLLALAPPAPAASLAAADGWLVLVTEDGVVTRPGSAAEVDARAACGGGAPETLSCRNVLVRTAQDWTVGFFFPAAEPGVAFFEGRIAMTVKGSDGREQGMDCPIFVAVGAAARGVCTWGGSQFPGMGATVTQDAVVSEMLGHPDLAPMGEWRAFLDL